MNVKPICATPQDGCLSTGGGLRLCTNPAHRLEPDFGTRGPVWHRQEEWPVPQHLQVIQQVVRKHRSYPYGEVR